MDHSGRLREVLERFERDLEPEDLFRCCAQVIDRASEAGLGDDPQLLAFVAADSEVDHLLIGVDPELFGVENLERRTKELEMHAAACRQDLREAAEALIARIEADASVVVTMDHPDTTFSVTIEEDALVAYAYLVHTGSIVGHVWLYNVGDTPETVDWDDRDGLPFQNPAPFCVQIGQPSLATTSITCAWRDRSVDIYFDGIRMARIAYGEFPGRSRYATTANPLARPFEDHQSIP